MAPELKQLDLSDDGVREAFALQAPYDLDEVYADDPAERTDDDQGDSPLDRQIFAGLVTP